MAQKKRQIENVIIVGIFVPLLLYVPIFNQISFNEQEKIQKIKSVK